MKTSKTSRKVIVGLFIFVALLIFIGGVLTLGGDRRAFASTFTLNAVFADVNGLQRGANIWLSGVKVGNVSDVSLNDQGTVNVEMSIMDSYQEYIHKNTRAKLSTDGLIGNKIVVLYGGSNTSPLVQGGEMLEVDKPLQMDQLMTTLQSNNQNILEITNDFKNIIRKLAQGEGTIGKLLQEDNIAIELQRTMAGLQRATRNAESLTVNLSSYASRFNQPGSLPYDIVHDTSVFSNLKTSLGTVNELTRRANAAMSQIQEVSQTLSTDLKRDNSAAGVLLRDEQTASDLKDAIHNLKTSTEKLDQNMEALQSNFLFRGFFRRKARDSAKM